MLKGAISSLIILIFATKALAGSLDAAYQEGLNVAQLNKQKPMERINDFNPSDKFEKYTENPSQTKYYHGIVSDSAKELLDDGNAAYTYNEDDTKNDATQAALKGFKKNPKLKIDPNDPNNPWMSRSKDIMENAPDIAIGASSKPNEVLKNGASPGINCKESKVCRIDYVKKTCNESEPRSIQRICDKVVTNVPTSVKDIVYPNCQSVVVAKAFRGGCPAGYRVIAESDMVRHANDDDINICLKTVSANEGSECYGGHLIYGISGGSGHYVQNTGKATVPKKMHGRLRVSDVHSGSIKVTIVNETTGQTVHNAGIFTNGQVVELPFSETQEQVFRFEEPPQKESGFMRLIVSDIGVMILTFDHRYSERTADAPVWQESCRDV